MASTSLYRTESAGNRRTFTWSAWVKRSKLGGSQFLASCSYSASDEAYIYFNGDNQLLWQVTGGSSHGELQTNRKFNDTNGWYNIILAFDTTQSTSSNRMKLYINGVQETSFLTVTYPSQDTQVYWNVGGSYYPRIGKAHANANNFDGLMSHVVGIDGTQELPTIFGSTDSTTGEWKIKTSITPSVGWGTNGYHILKDGNSLTDQSGQGNNWTAIGTLTKTEDNPSNVFCTMNPLTSGGTNSVSFNRGNNQVNFDHYGQWWSIYSTLGAITGKYYAEVLTDAIGGETSVGIISSDTASLNQGTGDYIGKETDSIGYLNNGRTMKANSNQQTGLTALSSTSVVGIAMDLDNNSVQFYVNGASTGNAISLTANKFYLFGTSGYSGARHRWNFGNGYFGSTQISSAGTNASGNGIFEYDVPTGFTALSTKGLNL
jgi:hypothetical protein